MVFKAKPASRLVRHIFSFLLFGYALSFSIPVDYVQFKEVLYFTLSPENDLVVSWAY